jgi:thiol-disulfide isomerase/thioredoxin
MMEIVLLTVRLILAAVFGIAGAAKLADREGSRKALAGFGVPESLAAPLALILPVAELAVAAALLPLGTAWFGGIGALILLLAFSIGIGVNLARGNSPDCHCFGQLHSEPVSWKVFARNLALAGVAGLIVVAGNPGLSAFTWLSDLKAGEIVSLVISIVAVGLLAAALVSLRRVLAQQTVVMEKLEAVRKIIDEDYAEPAPIEREDAAPPVEGLPVGALAPNFSLESMSGSQVSLEGLLSGGKPVLLFFVSPTCSPCKSLLPMVSRWEREFSDWLSIAVLSRGTLKDNQSKMSKYEIRHLLLQGEADVADEYQARWTPAAVLIGRDGKIASPVTSGDEAIRALINHTVTTNAAMIAAGNTTNGLIPQVSVGKSLFKVGEPAPRFSLPDEKGKMVSLESLLGDPTLLVFWSSKCSFCVALIEDLKRWEAEPPKGAPKIVFLNSGFDQDKREGFSSQMLIDQDFDIGPLFGTNGTPSAILIDGEGRIASSMATGATNILALAGVRRRELPLAKNGAGHKH